VHAPKCNSEYHAVAPPGRATAERELGDEFVLPQYEGENHLTDDRCFDSLSAQKAYNCFACRARRGRKRG
jgi:hypothetical protein